MTVNVRWRLTLSPPLMVARAVIFAAVGMMLFDRNDPQHFGTLIRAMMTIWQIETLDGWEQVLYVNSEWSALCASCRASCITARFLLPGTVLGCKNFAYVMRLPLEEEMVGESTG